MTPSLWWFSGMAVLVCVAAIYRWAWKGADRDARTWERRAWAAGYCPKVPASRAPAILREIFRPLGARPREDAASLSTQADVSRLREWREHRATKGIDHHTRHFAEGVTDSECAREILQFTVGGWEIDQ
jgi:hypothetical protein